jgi:hypothetical protein
MVYAFCETSTCWVGHFKHLCTRDMKVFRSNGILDLAKYSWVSNIEIVFKGGDKVVN